MSHNTSLEFLNMIKNPSAKAENRRSSGPSNKKATENHIEKSTQKSAPAPVPKEVPKEAPNSHSTIAVIDTETNWYNEVMSIGIALADASTFKCVGAKYYIIDPEYRKGGMYSSVLNIAKNIPKAVASREAAMADISNYLRGNGVGSLYAYNAKFDYGHLEELSDFDWFDIMRLAAYKQFNSFIPASAALCKSGRLKSGYSVENILRMISGNASYCETHNAVIDAMDELRIMELLGHDLDAYGITKL